MFVRFIVCLWPGVLCFPDLLSILGCLIGIGVDELACGLPSECVICYIFGVLTLYIKVCVFTTHQIKLCPAGGLESDDP